MTSLGMTSSPPRVACVTRWPPRLLMSRGLSVKVLIPHLTGHKSHKSFARGLGCNWSWRVGFCSSSSYQTCGRESNGGKEFHDSEIPERLSLVFLLLSPQIAKCTDTCITVSPSRQTRKQTTQSIAKRKKRNPFSSVFGKCPRRKCWPYFKRGRWDEIFKKLKRPFLECAIFLYAANNLILRTDNISRG